MSPRTNPEERRAQILNAAQCCFVRTGYHRTSMDDIVEESGLSKGTLYWYFENKRALFMALFDKLILDFAAPMQHVIDEALPVIKRLHLMMTSLQVEAQTKEMLKLPFSFMVEFLQDEEFMQHLRSVLETFAVQVEALIEEGITSGELRDVQACELAWGLMALLDGLLMYYITGMTENTSRQVNIMADLIIEGLRKR